MENLKRIAFENKIEYISAIPFREKEGFSSMVIALLPYYAGEKESYLSKYTRGRDYHKEGRDILSSVLEEWGEMEYEILIDVSPYNERELAYKAGLGKLGKNGLLINEKYGSFVFIVTALIKREINSEVLSQGRCINCKKCINACPGNAISEEGIDYLKCLSNITQKRQLTPEEELLIKNNKSVWGCDACQDCCPMNNNSLITPLEAFKNNMLLEINDIEELSQKEFKRKYNEYALAYKGKNIILRNIKIIKNT